VLGYDSPKFEGPQNFNRDAEEDDKEGKGKSD